MKRIIIIISMLVCFCILFASAVYADEVTETAEMEDLYEEFTTEPEPITPVVVSKSKTVKPGGDKIHIIKIFEQKCGSDAILLESDGHYGMVDVGLPYDFQYDGAQDTENSVVNYLESYGVEKLDFIILTHMHIDHIGNLENVLRSFPVDVVYARSFDYPTTGFVYFLNRKKPEQICKTYHVQTGILKEGQEIALGNLTVKAFNLDDDFYTQQEGGGDNNNCVGLLVTDLYGHKAFLAADINNCDGDEDRMVQNHYDELADVDYLKVGHHGYQWSSTYDFIQMLNPLYTTITGWEISRGEDPCGAGQSVRDNFADTRSGAQKAFYSMYRSKNGIIFTMGESLSINTVFTSPSRLGKANNTLSVHYNANGGSISKERKNAYYIDASGTICSLKEDWQIDSNYVQQRAQAGSIAPMYYYDLKRSFETARVFGLERKGHTFAGWYNGGDKNIVYTTNLKYDVLDIAPVLKKASSEIVLLARWNANPYQILFHANGGSGSMERMDCLYNKREALEANGFSRKQYVFRGWNTKADGSGASYQDEEVIKNLTDKKGKVVTLYAQWEKIGVGAPESLLLSSK